MLTLFCMLFGLIASNNLCYKYCNEVGTKSCRFGTCICADGFTGFGCDRCANGFFGPECHPIDTCCESEIGIILQFFIKIKCGYNILLVTIIKNIHCKCLPKKIFHLFLKVNLFVSLRHDGFVRKCNIKLPVYMTCTFKGLKASFFVFGLSFLIISLNMKQLNKKF